MSFHMIGHLSRFYGKSCKNALERPAWQVFWKVANQKWLRIFNSQSPYSGWLSYFGKLCYKNLIYPQNGDVLLSASRVATMQFILCLPYVTRYHEGLWNRLLHCGIILLLFALKVIINIERFHFVLIIL